MTIFILYKENNEIFDFDDFLSCLKKIDNIFDLKTDLDTCKVSAKYDYNNDSTILWLSKSLTDITIDGAGDASIQLIYRLGKEYNKDKIYLIDSDYSFDPILLNSVANENELIE
ncbi:MAG: hypothetical protein MJB14_17540, partial [Spirochaetes bacterium]|nr:hypothetical protein [Spirochaetota bacterium]